MKMFTWLRVNTLRSVIGSLVAAFVLLGPIGLSAQATYPGQIGVEVSDRPTGFVDAFKNQGRLFQDSNGNAVPTDANGWPTADGEAVVFDDRAIPAWNPPVDDPSGYQPDCSGTYSVSFNGEATLSSVAGNPTLTFANQVYNPATNTTTVNVTLPAGQPSLMVINFTNTQRTASSPVNTGITNLQVIRPGFALNTTQVFDPAFLTALAPFSYLRFMGWLNTNFDPGYYGDTGHHLIQWADRSLPTDAYQGIGTGIRAGAEGMSWEYIILLANATNKDIWINIPVSATGGSDSLDPTYDTSTNSYIYQLAELLKNGDAFTGNKGLNPGLHIYIEHSNEVWNYGFSQYTWNKLAAVDEVGKGGSVLNNDGSTDQEVWARRRHAKRLYEIAKIFETVFGSGSLNTTIRPVFAWWILYPSQYQDVLTWMNNTYGPPSNYFYALAQTDYFNDQSAAADATVPQVLAAMQANSDAGVSSTQQLHTIAVQFGLKQFAYEAGPDNGGGSTTNIGNRIEANRDPGMNTLLQYHVRHNWFPNGPDGMTYFALSSAYSRYGSWGATDDYRNLSTAKYNALENLLGYTNNGIPVPPGGLVATAGNQQVLLTWNPVPGAAGYNVKRGTTTGGPYTTLGTVSSGTYTDSSVTNGTTYYYVVTAENASGESGPSNEVNATPVATVPAAPASLTATAGSGQATLTWNSVAGATSYNVYQGTTAGGESSTPIATGITTTAYTVSDLTNGSTYYFEVAAVNSLGTGAVSNEVSVTPSGPPAAPTGLSAVAGDGQVTLSWTAATGATSYEVYQGTTAGGESTTPVATDITGTSYQVTGLTDGSAYYFTVAAVNGAGASGASNEATATPSTAPPPSGVLAYEPFGEAAGTLNNVSGGGDSGWASAWVVQNGSTDVPGYDVASTSPLSYMGLVTNGNYGVGGDSYLTAGRELNVTAGGPFNTYLSNGLIGAPGQTIWLSFLMRKDKLDGQAASISLNASANVTWVQNPAIAAGYFGAASNDSSGNPYWSLQFAAANATPIATVQTKVPVVAGQPVLMVLEVTFGANGAQNTVNLFVNPTSLGAAAPATPDAQYSTASSVAFQSLAYYGGDGSGASSLDEIRIGSSFAAVTPTPANEVPAAPTGLSAVAGNGQVTLSWNAVTGATSYQVWGTSGGNYSEFASAVTGASYTATGLTNGTNYTFYVTASNTSGTSSPSQPASATPVAPVLIAPTGLAATAGNGQVSLSWTAATGATSYNVYQGTTAGGESSTPVATGITGTTDTVSGLTNGTAYYFTVAAVSASGTSSYSNEATATPSGGSYGTPTPITVPNYSFELDQVGYNYPQDWTFNGTTDGGASAAQYVSNTATPGITGTNYWSPLDCGQQTAPYGTETTTLTSAAPLGTFAAGTQYVLTVALGSPDDGQLATKSIGFELLANGVEVASYTAPTSGAGALVPANGLTDYSLAFDTSSNPQVIGQNITVALVYTHNGPYCKNANFDNVRLTSAQSVTPPPTAPTSLTATAGDGQVSLGWTAVTGATSYNVYQGTTAGGEGTTPVATGITGTSYNVTGLTDGTLYYFTVAAVNAGGTSSASNEASATPASSGSTSGVLAYEPFGDTSGPLNGVSGGGDNGWSAGWVVQNGSTNVPGYNVASSNPINYPGLLENGNYGTGGDSYLTAGRALDMTSGGPFNAYLSNGLIGAPGQTVWLSFLMRKDKQDGQAVSIGMNTINGANVWVQNLGIQAGYFGTASNDANGNPFWSLQFAVSNATPIATVQTKVPVVAGQPVLMVLEITFGANGAQNTANLFVNPTSLGGAAPATPDAQYSTASSLAFQSLTYYGGNDAGESSVDEIRIGTSFAAVTPSAPIILPTAPTSLTAAPTSAGANLSWTAVTGATSYNVYQGTTAGGESASPVATGVTGNTFTVSGLTNNSTYYFVVAAVNSSGASGYSNEVSVTPSADDGIPAAPTGLTAGAGDSQVTLNWSPVPGAATYNVYEGSATGGENSTPIATGISTTTYNVSGLTDGVAYYFKVAAVNSYGTSPLSTEASATPAAPVTGTNAPADFSIYSQVVASNPVPLGFNMAPAAGVSITENTWLSDGGFSTYDSRWSFGASQDGTATTLIATGGGGTSFYSSFGNGYFVGATARTYRYSSGAWSLLRTDTVSGFTANSGSTAPADNTITFANSGPQILQGDVTWLSFDNVASVPNVSQLDPRFTAYYPNWSTESQNGQTRGTTWPATLVTDVPSANPGSTSMEITDSTAEVNGIWQYMQGAFNGPADEQFQPGHTYEVDVWLKQSGVSDGSVTFTIQGMNVSHTFTGVNDTWQHFTWTFPAVPGLPANSVQPSAHLDFNAPGTLDVNSFQLYDTAWAPDTLNPQVMQAWQQYRPGTIRIWSNFGNGSGGYSFWSLDSWLTPELQARNTPGIGNQYENPGLLEHLPDALAHAKEAGANPWLIVNMALSEQEWGELIDYLAAPAGVGYAAKRPASHPGPYTDDFSQIYLEVGNEEWGTQYVPVDYAYGQWAHFVASQATANKSYFDSSKIKFVVNSFFLNPSFGSAAAKAAPEASVVDYALYSSGDTSLSGDAYFQSDLLQLPQTNKPLIDQMVAQQQLDAASGTNYTLAAYEEGPGADTPAHQGDTSLAAGVGAIDVALYASQNGFGPQNFFLYNLGTGPYTSHSNFANGFRPHPVWEAFQMRNQYCAGPMVWVNTNSVPTSTDGHASPLIGVYAFHEANNQADVVVISRDLNNATPVTLHFPAVPSGNAQLYTLTGNPRIGNDDAMNIPIGNESVPVTQNYTFTMPPGSMYIFQVPMTGNWSTTEAAPVAPADLSAVADNGKVELTWSPSTGATSYSLQRATVSGGPYVQIATTSGDGYTDTTAQNGTTYYYVVAAVNAGGSSANSPEASATPNLASSGEVSAQPPLDGSDSGSWANAPWIPLTHYFSGSSTDTAQYKTLWDNNYLYVLASVQDNTLVAPPESAIWNGDAIELYFSGTDSKATSYGPTDFQYAFPYGNGGAVVTESHHNAVSGVLFAQQNIPGGYQMAIAIPWTTLGTTPVAGQQYGFDVMVDDASAVNTRTGKLGWWATEDQTWGNPSLMGPLVLGAQVATPSTLALTTPNTAPPVGTPVVLTAKASSSGAVPTGTVVFSSGSSNLCSSPLDATGATTCSYTPAASGSVNITAQYQGDSNHLPSSANLALNVYDAAVQLKLSATQLVYPGATNVTACVTGGQSRATGSINIVDGTTVLTTKTLGGDGCAYWYISPGLNAGTRTLTASYVGDATHAAGISAATAVTVAPVPVNMPVSCWNASYPYGANYQCTVSASSNAGAVQGAITYAVDGGAPVSATLSGGNAKFTIANPVAGSHTVVIAYAQQGNFAAVAPQTESFTVTPAPVNVSLTPSSYYIGANEMLSLASTITSWSAGAPNATGSVSFYNGSTLLAAVPVDSSGHAVYTTSSLAAGSQTITATYAGGANYASGSSTATITVHD